MPFTITSWNLEPNQEWFVRLYNATTGIGVELYENRADADVQANIITSAISAGFGTGKEIVFNSTSVWLFQSAYDWHLLVSGVVTDPAIVYRVKAFVDLDELDHPIFRNNDLALLRAGSEIDSHTHAVLRYSVETGVYFPTLEPGDIVALVSTVRGFSKLVQVTEHGIEYNQEDSGDTSLTSRLEVSGYMALNR